MDVLPVTSPNKDINNANLLRPWLLKVKRKDPPVSKHSYLCSKPALFWRLFYSVCGRKRASQLQDSVFHRRKSQSGKLPFITQLHMKQQRITSACNLTYKELPYFKIYSNNSARVALLTWISQLWIHCSLFFCLFEVVSPLFLLVPKGLASGLKAFCEVSY